MSRDESKHDTLTTVSYLPVAHVESTGDRIGQSGVPVEQSAQPSATTQKPAAINAYNDVINAYNDAKSAYLPTGIGFDCIVAATDRGCTLKVTQKGSNKLGAKFGDVVIVRVGDRELRGVAVSKQTIELAVPASTFDDVEAISLRRAA